MNEIYVMILTEGKWGYQIKRLQKLMNISAQNDLKTNLKRLVLKQDKIIQRKICGRF